MSENSDYSSGSYQALFSRMKLGSRKQPVAAPAPKKIVQEAAPKTCNYSVAKRTLSESGYMRYNIDDSDDLYISKVPESAMFNDGEAVLTKAESNVMVGFYATEPTVEVEPVVRKTVSAAEMFADVQRGSEQVVCTSVGTRSESVGQ
jgi:hypothetical protein